MLSILNFNQYQRNWLPVLVYYTVCHYKFFVVAITITSAGVQYSSYHSLDATTGCWIVLVCRGLMGHKTILVLQVFVDSEQPLPLIYSLKNISVILNTSFTFFVSFYVWIYLLSVPAMWLNSGKFLSTLSNSNIIHVWSTALIPAPIFQVGLKLMLNSKFILVSCKRSVS